MEAMSVPSRFGCAASRVPQIFDTILTAQFIASARKTSDFFIQKSRPAGSFVPLAVAPDVDYVLSVQIAPAGTFLTVVRPGRARGARLSIAHTARGRAALCRGMSAHDRITRPWHLGR
jgi:hypothetical protein